VGVSRFEDLVVWQHARKYCAEIGRATDTPEFFKDGVFRPRMTKTALSIVENIAEGFERESLPEFSQFLKFAKGSAAKRAHNSTRQETEGFCAPRSSISFLR
jgi:four helix bundle protein